jgi:hypothetical protein
MKVEEQIHFIIDSHIQIKLAQIIMLLMFSQEILGSSLDQKSTSLTVLLCSSLAPPATYRNDIFKRPHILPTEYFSLNNCPFITFGN